MQLSRVRIYELDLSAPEDQRCFTFQQSLLFPFDAAAVQFYGDRMLILGGDDPPPADVEHPDLWLAVWDYEVGNYASWLVNYEQLTGFYEVRRCLH